MARLSGLLALGAAALSVTETKAGPDCYLARSNVTVCEFRAGSVSATATVQHGVTQRIEVRASAAGLLLVSERRRDPFTTVLEALKIYTPNTTEKQRVDLVETLTARALEKPRPPGIKLGNYVWTSEFRGMDNSGAWISPSSGICTNFESAPAAKRISGKPYPPCPRNVAKPIRIEAA